MRAVFSVRKGYVKVLTSDEGTCLKQDTAKSLRISNRVGSIPQRVTFSDGSIFETADHAQLERCFPELTKGMASRIHFMERFHLRLLAVTAAIIFFIGFIYYLCLPFLVESAIRITPPGLTQMIASTAFESLDKAVLTKSIIPAVKKKRIQEDFRLLTSYARYGKDGYKLVFRNGGKIGANALALPDGRIILTDQLINWAGDDFEMIMAILAHEIGHVDNQDSLRQLYRSLGTVGLIMLITGDLGFGVEEILLQGASFLSLGYSRNAEQEADRFSMELMQKIGNDPRALIRFFDLLEKNEVLIPDSDIFSTHPHPKERKYFILKYYQNSNQAG